MNDKEEGLNHEMVDYKPICGGEPSMLDLFDLEGIPCPDCYAAREMKKRQEKWDF